MNPARAKFRVWMSSYRGKRFVQNEYNKLNGKCPNCNIQMEFATSATQYPNTVTVDHIISLYENPIHNESNLRLLCNGCNQTKSTMENFEVRNKRKVQFWKKYYQGKENIFVYHA